MIDWNCLAPEHSLIFLEVEADIDAIFVVNKSHSALPLDQALSKLEPDYLKVGVLKLNYFTIPKNYSILPCEPYNHGVPKVR